MGNRSVRPESCENSLKWTEIEEYISIVRHVCIS